MRKVLMAATVLLLLLLVIITPGLIGVREDISTRPRLILNYEDGEFIVFITSLSGTYVYRSLYLNITSVGGQNSTQLQWENNNSHGLEAKLDVSEMRHFNTDAVAMDQRPVFFDLSVEVEVEEVPQGLSFTLHISEESTPRILMEDDLPIPTLMQRRQTP